MPDGWDEVAIGDIAEVVAGGTPKTKEPSYWGGGIPWIVPSEVTRQEGQRITTTDRTITEAGLKSIRSPLLPVDTVLLTSRATVGAVALAGVPMAINQGFTALVGGLRVLPEFLMYWCQANRSTFESLAGGSTFPEVGRSTVERVVVSLPPLAEQRRIVDLMRSVDAVLNAATANVSAADSAKSAFMVSVLLDTAAQSLPVADVLSTVVGGVWGEPPGERSLDVSALGLVAFNVTDHQVDPSLGTPRSLDPGTADSRSLVRHDIVLERSGGTKDRPVGRVITAPKDMPSVVPTDFMRLLRVDARRAEPRYVYWWLWGCYERGDTIPFQTQTTNIRNLRVKDYLNEPIRLPDREHQQRVVGTMDAFSEVTNRGRAVVEALIRLRAGLLDDLLSGRHRVPSSYDRFLDSAA